MDNARKKIEPPRRQDAKKMSWRINWRVGILLVGYLTLLVPLALAGTAADSSVSIKGGFSPAKVSIHPGDSVTWTNDDDRDHNVTADDGSFASGNLKAGKTFSHTFSAVGTFAYSDSLHPREKGQVVVGK